MLCHETDAVFTSLDEDNSGTLEYAELSQKLAPYLSEVQLVAVSPLTRAMQTATGGAPRAART